MIGRERLTQMYKDWMSALERLQMARQTAMGAEQDAVAKEARFKGAVEVLGGAGATWTFEAEKGVQIHEPGEGPPEAGAPPDPGPVFEDVTVNGHKVGSLAELAKVAGPVTRRQRREQARQAKKGT